MKPAARTITTLLAVAAVGGAIGVAPLYAQIAPNPDTGTIVTPVGNRFDISGGALSADNANLFHSLSQFGLTQNQIANFLSNPATRNILVRVTGGDASRVDGLIQVSGSNANLFLMNPAGIVFGANASLNVAGSFTATTSTGIGLGANWFNAAGTNDYATLVGDPSSYAFTVAQPGAIVNAGNLAVGMGQQLALIGGTVVSTGSLSAPEGQIIVAAVPGQSVVSLSQPGAILGLDIQRPAPTDRITTWTLPVLSLPQLLTGGSATNATGLIINANGQTELTGSGVQITPGDVAVRQTTAAAGGTLLRATGTVLTNAFPLTSSLLPSPPSVPSRANRINTIVPPDQALPLAPSPIRVTAPPASIRQAAPPDAVLPSTPSTNLVVPDCGAACPISTKAPSQPLQPPPTPQSTDNTSAAPPIVTFPQNSNQINHNVVVLPEALPQYASQSSATQTSGTPPASTQASFVQSNAAQINALQPINPVLPMGDPDENLSNGTINDMNQAAALARRLAAIKQHVQQRWKPTSQLSHLQYQLRLDRKGAIQQVVPLGQEAAAYLAELKLMPVDTPAARQTMPGVEVIVTLNPDGTVEVIPNSLTLRSAR